MFHGSRILVAPLDWGLGHATRCIPVIRRLLHYGAQPVIGADKAPAELLREEFPDLEFHRIEGRPVRYSSSGDQSIAIALQLPSLLRSISREHDRTKKVIDAHRIDAIISDQRFGVRDPRIPSVLMTHQLFPQLHLARRIATWMNQRHIDRFDRCWVVDRPDPPGLAGDLSHGRNLPGNARYIGALSRFAPIPHGSSDRRIVAIISGPEPQRSLLEKILIRKMDQVNGTHLLVRGMPGAPIERTGNITIVPHLPTERLAEEIMNCKLLVARCGYSTIMDLKSFGRSALLIPTPGHPEQEYLGKLHSNSGEFIIQTQHAIDLETALSRIGDLMDRPVLNGNEMLDRALQELAGMVKRRPVEYLHAQ